MFDHSVIVRENGLMLTVSMSRAHTATGKVSMEVKGLTWAEGKGGNWLRLMHAGLPDDVMIVVHPTLANLISTEIEERLLQGEIALRGTWKRRRDGTKVLICTTELTPFHPGAQQKSRYLESRHMRKILRIFFSPKFAPSFF